jgi:hypothetical protein
MPTIAEIRTELDALDTTLRGLTAAHRAAVTLTKVQPLARAARPDVIPELATPTAAADLESKIGQVKSARKSAAALLAACEQYWAPAAPQGSRNRRRSIAESLSDEQRVMGASGRILEALRRERDRSWSRTELADAAKVISMNTVGSTLTKLRRAGLVENEGNGWTYVGPIDDGTAADPGSLDDHV